MSATDELRRLLDERGVRHYDTPNGTCWGYLEMPLHGRMYTHYAVEVDDLLCLDSHCITPEQAIDATLGRGTCRDTSGGDPCVFVCSYCGETFDHPENERVRYCPNCGRKVVE